MTIDKQVSPNFSSDDRQPSQSQTAAVMIDNQKEGASVLFRNNPYLRMGDMDTNQTNPIENGSNGDVAFRRMPGISWTAKKSNVEVVREAETQNIVRRFMRKAGLNHLITIRMLEDKRSRGR
ncbi:hypothetical protein PoB_006138000 [Plakobranchus ocellatus]|uniref:Uncharacterized protein n=1 Tax=Plakobranchus ocellatus TaxID=259542 RepID=A0AAV4CSJ0_9GAST|nr:hypothetical protein PoB_006138000 [Plakobranchus ocellatus]